MPLILPQCFQDELVNAPEASYGVNDIKVVLKSGKKYEHVLVAWGREVIKVNGSSDIPFRGDDIQAIEVNN